MSTNITLRIQDKIETTSRENPNPQSRGVFPFLPGPTFPSHLPFNLILNWTILPGLDTWRTDIQGLLPVTSGLWEVMEPSRSRVGRYFSYVSIKTDDAGGAREFMLLSTDYEHIHDPGLFGPTLHGPFTKGDAGEGCYMSSAVGGGTLNRDFVWKCTSIV